MVTGWAITVGGVSLTYTTSRTTVGPITGSGVQQAQRHNATKTARMMIQNQYTQYAT